MGAIKESLLTLCIEKVQLRIDTTRSAIRLLQQSANEETKSSVGDKYETGRAMAQLEIEKLGTQLIDARAQLVALQSISVDQKSTAVQLGSVAVTSQGKFYMSVSIGDLDLSGEHYFAISPRTPLGQKLIGCVEGNSFVLNGKTFELSKVF